MKIVGKAAWFFVAIVLLANILLPARLVQAAAGFHTSGKNLPDVNDNNFIVQGINHLHIWYLNQTSSFANWEHVTLYRNSVLVWGTEP